MLCKKCGTDNANGNAFCQNCGAPLVQDEQVNAQQESYSQNMASQQQSYTQNEAGQQQSYTQGTANQQSVYNQNGAYNQQTAYGQNGMPYQQPYMGNANMSVNENMIPEEYKPISMWGYFGYEILFSIPCVGFILLLVFSFGGTKNKNLKNFARSYFCLLIILAILVVIVIAVGGIGITSASYRYY